MGADLIQHMVQEGDPGVIVCLAGAIQIQGYGDIGFTSSTMNRTHALQLGMSYGDLGMFCREQAIAGLHSKAPEYLSLF
jgi:hypothetical protein